MSTRHKWRGDGQLSKSAWHSGPNTVLMVEAGAGWEHNATIMTSTSSGENTIISLTERNYVQANCFLNAQRQHPTAATQILCRYSHLSCSHLDREIKEVYQNQDPAGKSVHGSL